MCRALCLWFRKWAKSFLGWSLLTKFVLGEVMASCILISSKSHVLQCFSNKLSLSVAAFPCFWSLFLLSSLDVKIILISSLYFHLKTLHRRMPPTFPSENSLSLFYEDLWGKWKVKRNLMNGQKFHRSYIAPFKKMIIYYFILFPLKYWLLKYL